MQISVNSKAPTGPTMVDIHPGDIFQDPCNGRWYLCAEYPGTSSRYNIDLISGKIHPINEWNVYAVVRLAADAKLNIEV